jgi:hypothetical protein
VRSKTIQELVLLHAPLHAGARERIGRSFIFYPRISQLLKNECFELHKQNWKIIRLVFCHFSEKLQANLGFFNEFIFAVLKKRI